MLRHIGFTIQNRQDIKNFYKDLLGFEELSEFKLPAYIAKKIFNFNEQHTMTRLQKDDLIIELFWCKDKPHFVYNHVAIEVDNRDKFIKKVKDKGYPVTICPPFKKNDIIFIEDNSGNKFEIMNIAEKRSLLNKIRYNLKKVIKYLTSKSG